MYLRDQTDENCNFREDDESGFNSNGDYIENTPLYQYIPDEETYEVDGRVYTPNRNYGSGDWDWESHYDQNKPYGVYLLIGGLLLTIMILIVLLANR